MTSRKDQLKSLFQPQAAPEAAQAPVRAASGAVKAMGLSLSGLQRELDEARLAGERVADLDPALIDASPYADRLSDGADNDEEFAALVTSIRQSGQQVPVLVRPGQGGRYVAAYGHRRIKAARELGIAVKALVRPLSNAELLMAQGKENSERRNLSFIEKAMFVKALMEAGVERAKAQEALSLHKAEMTRLIQVGDMIPAHIARAIGPAPKAGRPRWMALGSLLQKGAGREKAEDEIDRPEFRAAASDRRFQMLHDRLARKAKAAPDRRELKSSGVTVAVSRAGKGTRLDIEDAGFAAFLEENFVRLAKEYASGIK